MRRIVSKRAYDSSSRRKTAEATRQSIIAAARRVFLEKGYAAATMPAIAREAGIALDTVYESAGKKPDLFRLLIEMAISGSGKVVPAQEREYVRAIHAEPDAAKKLHIYAAALRRIHPRLAPLIQVLQGAASLDPELASLWQSISRRRAKNMRKLANELAGTGRLRSGISTARAADVIWSMNSPEFYLLLIQQRRWSPKEYEQWLADSLVRLLLDPLISKD